MTRRRPLWAAAACGVVLGLGSIVALDAATELADAQGEFTVSAEQLQINQRISQAAVRRSNEALGLLGPVRPAESTDKNPVNPFSSIARGSGWPTSALADGAVTASKLSAELRAQVDAPGPPGPQGDQGPQGLEGPPGLSAIERVLSPITGFSSGSTGSASAECPAPKVPMGGGVSQTNAVGTPINPAPGFAISVTGSFPGTAVGTPGNSAWIVYANNPTIGTAYMRAFAVCARVEA